MRRSRIVLILVSILGALLLGLVVGVGVMRFVPAGPDRLAATGSPVISQIQSLAQLVTVKYVIEKVVVQEDVAWYGQNRVLLVAHGVVKAGVDLDRLEPEDIEVDGTRIRIKLPPPQIIDAYLDPTQTRVVENSTGVLRLANKDLESEARKNAVSDIRRAARNNGILQDAEERAELQLRALLGSRGFDRIEFAPR